MFKTTWFIGHFYSESIRIPDRKRNKFAYKNSYMNNRDKLKSIRTF